MSQLTAMSESTAMSPLLETKNLKKTFGAVVAASDINITINHGEILGVIGSNGAGKTTFVNMITGYLTPSEGNILYEGKDITGAQSRDITRMGICRSFQIPQLFNELTVLENITTALTMHRERKPVLFKPAITQALIEEASAILQRFEITDYADYKITALPQGIRKLIDIAMATVSKPKILFLDEPTSGVSSDEKMGIMHVLMNALKDQNVAVLFIEHDMEVIEAFAPRVIAFYEGTVLCDDTTEAVLSNQKVREYVIGSHTLSSVANDHA